MMLKYVSLHRPKRLLTIVPLFTGIAKGFLLSFFFLIVIVLCLPLTALAQEDFESFKQEQGQAVENFIQKRNEDFKKYQRRIRQAFSEYREKAAAVWGQEQAAVPSRKEWVSYRKKMRERRQINFDAGKARYEIALDPGKKEVSKSVRFRLVDSIVDSITKGSDQRSIERIAANPDNVELGGRPLLRGLFKTDLGRVVTQNNAEEFARKKVQNRLKKSEVEGEDGQERVVASVEIPMIPDHLRKRAERYEDIVKNQAKSRSLSPELVFAIIETESYFNPQARSPVPAFGLMQLVPVTGGQEAYEIVYGEKKQPSEELLYQPRENVTLGSAYFHRLYYTYMEGIENDKSRLWCSVASYNTGPGNLFDTFSKKSKSVSIHRINSMSHQEVFQYLVNNLPYEETRDYLQKVRKKMPKYQRL